MEVKDVTPTTFGFLIAYVLPGFAGLFALSFWSESVKQLLQAFITAEVTVGRTVVLLFASIVIGIELTALRWIVFEKLICRAIRRDRCDFAGLTVEPKLTAFRSTVDEYFRYHQFWAGLALVTPFIGWQLVASSDSCSNKVILILIFLAVEALNIVAAYSAFKNYIDTAERILSHPKHG